jgi:hypothetical protein
MLDDIRSAYTSQLVDVRLLLKMIQNLEVTSTPLSSSREATISKGLFFVHLYGVYEYTVTSAVQRTIQHINAMSCTVNQCKPILLSIVLDSECTSLSSAGQNSFWPRRWKLFEKLSKNDPIQINDNIFPTNGKNIRYDQLNSIWTTFCVKDPPIPATQMFLKGRVNELVENRNAIAHGRMSPADVGGRYSFNELEKRYKDIDELCVYIIDTLESYLINKDFLI